MPRNQNFKVFPGFKIRENIGGNLKSNFKEFTFLIAAEMSYALFARAHKYQFLQIRSTYSY